MIEALAEDALLQRFDVHDNIGEFRQELGLRLSLKLMIIPALK